MSYFTIDGTAVPIDVTVGDRETEVIKDSDRAADTGDLLESRTATKTHLTNLRTKPLDITTARTLVSTLAAATVDTPLVCGGDLVGSSTISCVATGRIGLAVKTFGGGVRKGVVSFSLEEV